MTGTLAQLIVLTTYGDQFLKCNELPDDFESNSVFQSCRSVDFREFRKLFFFSNLKEHVIASDALAWFRFLKKSGCKGLKIYYESGEELMNTPHHKLAGMIGGGGNWMIEAEYGKFSNYWAARWEVTHRDAPDNRIWTVSYGAIQERQRSKAQLRNIDRVRNELRDALTEISAFATKHGNGFWNKTFDRASAFLNDDYPDNNYYNPKLLPAGKYSLESRQLLYAAGTAWVFGGMGSWNDIAYDTKEAEQENDQVSATLYNAIIDSVIAVVNSQE